MNCPVHELRVGYHSIVPIVPLRPYVSTTWTVPFGSTTGTAGGAT